MKRISLTLICAGLFTLLCASEYKPTNFSFKFVQADLRGNPDFVSGIVISMTDVPLYFVDKNGNRDYVRTIAFHIIKRTDGTYEVAYNIKATRSSTDIWLNAAPQEQISCASQEVFPYFFKSTGETRGTFVNKIPSLYALKEDGDNKEFFKNSMNLINFFLPINKLRFDEEDLYVPIPKASWFSRLRNWWYGE